MSSVITTFPENAAESMTVVDDETRDTLLTALDDADGRAILEATDEEPLTASEISDACDLPLSTAYRKIDLLTEAGLLSERTRLRNSGKHTSEYERAVDDVVVSMDADGIEVRVAHREPHQPLITGPAGGR
jgi:DNA-binding transcriptional ArsR family regulator